MLRDRFAIPNSVMTAALLLIPAVGVLFKGLFYEPEQIAAVWLLAVAAVVGALATRSVDLSPADPLEGPHPSLAGSPVALAPVLFELAALSIPVLYLVAAFFSPSPHSALMAVLFVVAGGMAFRSAKAARNHTLLLRRLTWTLALTSLVAAVGGLLANMGLVDIPGALAQGYRVGSFFQYPDAFAAFTIVGVVCVIALAARKATSIAAAAGTVAGFLLFMAFFLAASRGAFLVFPVIVCLAVWLAPRGKAVNAIALSVLAGVSAIVVIRGFADNAAIQDAQHAIRWLGLGGLLSGAAGWAWPTVAPALRRLRRDRAVLAVFVAGAVVVGLGLGAMVLRFAPGADSASGPANLVSSLLPGFLSSRASSMSLEGSSAAQRLTYYADAIRALAAHPLGFGAGAWSSVFGHVQRFYYVGRNVHSQLLQVAVDAGIPALVAYVVFWLGFLALVWRARKMLPDDDRLILAATASGALALGIHGTIDFTLSYMALYLIVMIVAGALAGLAGRHDESRVPRALNKALALVNRVILWLAIGVLFAAPFMFVSSVAVGRGLNHLEAGQMVEAQADYEIAARFEPWSAPAWLGLARSTLARSRGGDAPPEMAIEAVNQAKLAVRFDRALSGGYGTLAETLLNLPDGSATDARDAVVAAEKAVAYQKYRPVYYPTLGEAYITLALRTDDETERSSTLDKLTGLPAVVDQRQAEIEPYRRLFRYPQVSMVPELALRVGQGNLLAGDFGAAEKYLTEAANNRALVIPSELWLYRLYQLTSEKAELEKLKAKPWILFSDLNPEFQRLRELTAKYEKKGGE